MEKQIKEIASTLQSILAPEQIKQTIIALLSLNHVMERIKQSCPIIHANFNEITNINTNVKNVPDLIQEQIINAEYQTNIGYYLHYIFLCLKNNSYLGEQEKIDKVLKEVILAIKKIDMSNDIDIFTSIHETLNDFYSGKSRKFTGEFFTPLNVAKLLATIAINYVHREKIKIYDPTCGTGSLLLQAGKIARRFNLHARYTGQELIENNVNLANINMLLNNVDKENIDIVAGDVLLNPGHKIKETFDIILSNPPFSTKWEGKDNKKIQLDNRFTPAQAFAPKSKGDLAFIMHSLHVLKQDGIACIICFPGILYRGNAEKKIRQYLIENNYIEAVIQLPTNLFSYTTISVNILILSKSKINNDIYFLDASKMYKKNGKYNILDKENIAYITNLLNEKKEPGYLAKQEEIIKQDYNLSINSYVQNKPQKEKVDIDLLNEQCKKLNEARYIHYKKIDELVTELEGNTE